MTTKIDLATAMQSSDVQTLDKIEVQQHYYSVNDPVLFQMDLETDETVIFLDQEIEVNEQGEAYVTDVDGNRWLLALKVLVPWKSQHPES